MSRKHALVIGPLPPPIGGDTVSTLNLLKSGYWDEYGIELDFVNTSAGGGVRLQFERLSAGDLLRAVKILFRVLVKLHRADVVLLLAANRFICTAGLPIILFSVLSGRPVVVKIFGTYISRRLKGLPRLWKGITAFTLERSSFVMPQTKGLVGELINDFGLSDSRVVLFPNFLPDRVIGNNFVRRRFSGKCIFAGQVKREKGVFDIIDALKVRGDLICDFYGQMAGRDEASFLEEIAGCDNLEYRGVVDPQEMRDVMGRYDVLLLPTYHGGEGYPAVVLEAFASGVVVVASNWKSIPDIVEDGVRGILVPVKSPGSIIEALDRLASDNALYGSIAEHSFEYVKSFSEKAVLRDILVERIAGLVD